MDPLIGAVLALIVGLGGGTGIAKLLRHRTDSTSAIVRTAHEFSDATARTARELLVPLTEQLAAARRDAEERVAKVRERIALVESEIAVSRQAEEHCQADLRRAHDRIEVLEAAIGGRRDLDTKT